MRKEKDIYEGFFSAHDLLLVTWYKSDKYLQMLQFTLSTDTADKRHDME